MEITRGEEALRVARLSIGMKKSTEIAMEEASQVAWRLLCQTWPQGGTTDSDTATETVSALELTHVVTSHLATPNPLLVLCCKPASGQRCEHSSCPNWAEHQPVVPLYINPPRCFLPWAVGSASSGLSLHVLLEALAKCCDSCVNAQHTNRGK